MGTSGWGCDTHLSRIRQARSSQFFPEQSTFYRGSHHCARKPAPFLPLETVMVNTTKLTALFLGILFLLVFPAFADRTNLMPAWNAFSAQQDIEMGRILADDLERTLQVVNDGDSNAYIDALGRQLTAHAPGNKYPYQFKIVDDGSVNVWALPGGFIYVTAGLIERAQNEPQLAGALAHAIGHVALRHGTAEVSRAYNETPG